MDVFISMIFLWPCNFAPYGWAFCDRSILQVNQYAALGRNAKRAPEDHQSGQRFRGNGIGFAGACAAAFPGNQLHHRPGWLVSYQGLTGS